METMLDKDLRDDMLKLVRYKILFVRREYEVSFPEQEDIVSENMDGDAFAAWKVAEFIQDLVKGETRVPQKWADKQYPQGFIKPAGDFRNGTLTGLPPEDKKYLRVYYEVLERYPREKFKYEEQQIRILEDIRDSLAIKTAAIPTLPIAPHDELVHYIIDNKSKLAEWRAGFAKWADSFANLIADTFNGHSKAGEFPTPHVNAAHLAEAFSLSLAGQKDFRLDTFDRFAATSKGRFRVYDLATNKLAIDPAPTFSVWDTTIPFQDGQLQKTTGSQRQYYWVSHVPDLSTGFADIMVNFFREDLGLTSWASRFQHGRIEMPAICYEIDDKHVFWINQLWTDQMEPMMGPNLFLVTLKSPGILDNKDCMFNISFSFSFDFASGKADVEGPTFY